MQCPYCGAAGAWAQSVEVTSVSNLRDTATTPDAGYLIIGYLSDRNENENVALSI
jgi:hypothetical protein